MSRAPIHCLWPFNCARNALKTAEDLAILNSHRTLQFLTKIGQGAKNHPQKWQSSCPCRCSSSEWSNSNKALLPKWWSNACAPRLSPARTATWTRWCRALTRVSTICPHWVEISNNSVNVSHKNKLENGKKKHKKILGPGQCGRHMHTEPAFLCVCF